MAATCYTFLNWHKLIHLDACVQFWRWEEVCQLADKNTISIKHQLVPTRDWWYDSVNQRGPWGYHRNRANRAQSKWAVRVCAHTHTENCTCAEVLMGAHDGIKGQRAGRKTWAVLTDDVHTKKKNEHNILGHMKPDMMPTAFQICICSWPLKDDGADKDDSEQFQTKRENRQKKDKISPRK